MPVLADIPPSIAMLIPVIHADSSDARYSAVYATSSGLPPRPSRGQPLKCRLNLGLESRACWVAGVAMGPGEIELQRMPCGAPSNASCLVMAMTPPLEAACAT